MGKTAILLGSTGLVGKECLKLLLNNPAYTKVVLLLRRKSEAEHPKLVQHLVDFENLSESKQFFQADEVFCCLGTTLKKAGSKQAFRRVDYNYVVEAAKLALQGGAKRFYLVSSLGADRRSLIFYSRVKGELEETLSQLGYDEMHFFRPSFLLGERNEKRLSEKFAIKLLKPLRKAFIGRLKKYRPIEASEVARAMVDSANKEAVTKAR